MKGEQKSSLEVMSLFGMVVVSLYLHSVFPKQKRFVFVWPSFPPVPPSTPHHHQRLQRMAKGRDQVYFLSASLEKLVFLVNSSNHVCRHMGVWSRDIPSRAEPRCGSMTLNSSQNKTMLASSGQYL